MWFRCIQTRFLKCHPKNQPKNLNMLSLRITLESIRSWLQLQLLFHHFESDFNHSPDNDLAYPSAHSDFSCDSVNTPRLWKHRSKSNCKPDIQGEYFGLKNKLDILFTMNYWHRLHKRLVSATDDPKLSNFMFTAFSTCKKWFFFFIAKRNYWQTLLSLVWKIC